MTTARLRTKDRRRCANACSNCRRRKERCNGISPCQRCLARGVNTECQFIMPYPLHPVAIPLNSVDEAQSAMYGFRKESSPGRWHGPPIVGADTGVSLSNNASDRNHLRPQEALLEREGGLSDPLGSSSTLALVKSLQHLAKIMVGDCPFTRHEPGLPGTSSFDRCRGDADIVAVGMVAAFKPAPPEADYLVRWYINNPGYVYYLFEGEILHKNLLAWLSDPHRQQGWTSCKFYLVLALGAQNCPENKDILAEQYYKYARALTLLDANEFLDTSIVAAQCYTLMTIYLLGSARIDAAFMQLGQAVRAANALGLHRVDAKMDRGTSEFRAREHLWKVIRVLDSFFSILLGRPMATYDLRNTTGATNYSTTIDMCMIFETLVTEVYTKQSFHDDLVQSILEQNRQWTARFSTGLLEDGIQSVEAIDHEEQRMPNISLIHIKHAFYGAMMLLTQKSLVEHVARNYASLDKISGSDQREAASKSLPLPRLAVVCIQSAIDAINLFKVLLETDSPPKRLPCAVTPIFYAGLILGVATLGGYHHEFNLEGSLLSIRKLLLMFSKHDRLAKEYLTLFEMLESTCQIYLTQVSQTKSQLRKALVNDLIGGLDHDINVSGSDARFSEHDGFAATYERAFGQDDSGNTDPSAALCWIDLDIDFPEIGLLNSMQSF